MNLSDLADHTRPISIHPFFSIRLLPILLGMLLGLSACTILGGKTGESTPTPLPTSTISNYKVIRPQGCRVVEQRMIRVEQPQGDLIAWSPATDALAYIASTQGTSWNVGELNLLTAPKFDSPNRLATQAAGELTWSSDASTIAYLGLRRSDNLYTIGLAYPDGRSSKDLFPGEAARTDDYSSQKSILDWMSSASLRVLVSCGVNCLQTTDVNVQSGLATSVGDPIERTWNTWAPHSFHPAIIPNELTTLPGQLNWSWDSKRIAYIDGNGNISVINVGEGTLYPLDIGQFGTATETDWSFDNQYLAVQVDQNLMIFSFQCP